MVKPTRSGYRDDLFRMAVVPVLHAKKPYVSQEALKRLKITLKHLDLKTGDIDHAKGTARLQPMSDTAIQQRPASRGGGFNKRMDDDDVYPRGDEDWAKIEREDPDARFTEAINLHGLAASYVLMWAFQDKTRWLLRGLDSEYLEYNDKEGVMRYETLSVTLPLDLDEELDRDRPCIMGYQAAMTPLVDGQLLTCELNALIVLATMYDQEPAYAGCDEFVITVITGCDRQVRLAQSKVNMARKTFDVSISKILDFEKSIKDNWDDWKTLLGWLAGWMTPAERWA